MFTRSKGLLLSLVALLGVFSSSVFAEEYCYAFVPESSPAFWVKGRPSQTVPEYDNSLRSACRAYGFGGYSNGFCTVDNTELLTRASYATCEYYGGDNLYEGEPPFTGSGACNVGSEHPNCVTSDSDGDGVPNALDSDSNEFNDSYCSTEPTPQICIDHDGGDTSWSPPDDGDDSGGDDGSGGGDTGGGGSGGGDTGGGSGGGSGGGLPSSCEGSATFSESCCFDHAEAQCLDEGGLYDWGYVSVGTSACNYTCNDEQNPPDNGGGDGSGGSGSDDTPTDDTDLITAVNTLQTANQTEFNAIQDDLNTLNQTNQAGFNQVRSAIENIQNPDLTALENSASQTATNTAAIASNLANLSSTVTQNSSAEQQLLSDLNNSIGGLNSDLNNIANQPFNQSDFDSQLESLPTPGFIVAEGMGDFETASGIDKDAELETRIVNLGEEINKYDPMLGGSSSECPADYSLTVAGAQYSISWTPVCDAFGILSIFVQAAAWFAVPFIVLGVGKK